MRVVQREVVDDHGHGQGQHQQATQSAYGAHDVAQGRPRVHVPVTQRRHGDHRPPEPDGDVPEVVLGALLRLLHVVDEAGEDEHPDAQHEDHEQELLGAGLQRVAQDLEARKVTSQPQDAKNADDAYGLKDVEPRRVLQRRVDHDDDFVDVEGHDGEEVDPCHEEATVHGSVRAEDGARHKLQREVGHARVLQHAQPKLGLRHALHVTHCHGVTQCDIEVWSGVAEKHVRLGHEDGNVEENEDHRHHGQHLGKRKNIMCVCVCVER